MEQELGLETDADLLDHLGQYVILHTYPPHPFRVPFMFTALVAIDNPDSVRSAIDALMSAWQRHLAEKQARTGRSWFSLRVIRGQDGIWYLRAGLNGPAVGVADRWLVISYSPEAVRANLRFLARASADMPNPSQR